MSLSQIQKRSTAIFILVSLLDLAGIILNKFLLQEIAKPLLIPVLIILLKSSGSGMPHKNLLLAGLFFSWAGDIFLLFDREYLQLFIFGLACFLITHILYICFFLRQQGKNTSLLSRRPWIVLLVIAFGVSLVVLLLPYLGELKIPVITYAAVICTMLICSLHAFTRVPRPSGSWFVAGAAFFVLSDSLLAINKFYHPFAIGPELIMATYCLAQFGIVKGFLVTDKS